jgi:hypothetical protein
MLHGGRWWAVSRLAVRPMPFKFFHAYVNRKMATSSIYSTDSSKSSRFCESVHLIPTPGVDGKRPAKYACSISCHDMCTISSHWVGATQTQSMGCRWNRFHHDQLGNRARSSARYVTKAWWYIIQLLFAIVHIPMVGQVSKYQPKMFSRSYLGHFWLWVQSLPSL